MYLGHIQAWIDNEIKNMYYDCQTKDLIAKYLEVLEYANQPLYPFQVKQMKKILENIEQYISEDIEDDLKNLSDKDLIIEYDLEPKVVSMKYHGRAIDDIKSSNKTEFLYKKDNFMKQYNLYIKNFGDKYE